MVFLSAAALVISVAVAAIALIRFWGERPQYGIGMTTSWDRGVYNDRGTWHVAVRALGPTELYELTALSWPEDVEMVESPDYIPSLIDGRSEPLRFTYEFTHNPQQPVWVGFEWTAIRPFTRKRRRVAQAIRLQPYSSPRPLMRWRDRRLRRADWSLARSRDQHPLAMPKLED